MNPRRKFLIQGTMATTALLAANSFKSFAEASSPLTGFSTNENKVILFHTGNSVTADHREMIKHITDVKNAVGNVVLLHAGNELTENAFSLKYDASLSQNNIVAATTNSYKIIYKGDIKIGIIGANETKDGIIDHISSLATYLKEEKNCHLVVCLSQLGYKNKNSADDLGLAAASIHLDIIIGGHANNYFKHPVIVLNKNKEEVIINHAAENSFSLGKIAIAFNKKQQKNNIAFNVAV